MIEPATAKPRYQFSLRSVFLGLTALGVWLGLLLAWARMFEVRFWPLCVVQILVAGFVYGTYVQWQRAKLRPLGVWRSLLQIAVCLYLPFSWLVLIDYPWDSYRLHWLMMWPVLPGLLPSALLFHAHSTLELSVAGLFTLAVLVGLTRLASRSEDGFLAATTAALCGGGFCAYAMLGAFLM